MSHPPEYPGRERLKRASARTGTDAYQGAFEAVGAVLVACGFGYWFDKSWETGPWGLIVGVVIGFAAMVLRLVRLGKELNPEFSNDSGGLENHAGLKENESGKGAPDDREEFGVGVAPGMSDVLREDAPEEDSRDDERR